jgi:hypothetical protein
MKPNQLAKKNSKEIQRSLNDNKFALIVSGDWYVKELGFATVVKVESTGIEILFEGIDKKPVPIIKVLEKIFNTQLNLPLPLQSLELTRFFVAYQSIDDGSTFTVKIDTKFKLTEKGKDFVTELAFVKKGNAINLAATVVYNEIHKFNLQFARKQISGNSKIASYIIGSYSFDEEIKIKKLLESFISTEGIKNFIPDVSISKFKTFLVKANIDEEVQPNSDKKKGSFYIFGLRIGIDSNKIIKSLPMVGEMLAPVIPFSLNEFILIYATGDEEANTFKHKNELSYILSEKLNIASPSLEIDSIKKGVNFFADISTSKKRNDNTKVTAISKANEKPIIVETDISKAGLTEEQSKNITPLNSKPESDSAGVSWKEVDFEYKGIKIKRVGYKVELDKNKVTLFIDANLSYSVFSLQVRGLSAEFDTKELLKKMPEFNFTGIGFSYKKSPIEIGGAFLKNKVPVTLKSTKKPAIVDGFSGGVVIQFSKFRIVGIGSYVSYTDGSEQITSLFLYGVLNARLGGIPEFFVTGIAAGFGYNRTLVSPDIEKVSSFPLVALVTQTEDTESKSDKKEAKKNDKKKAGKDKKIADKKTENKKNDDLKKDDLKKDEKGKDEMDDKSLMSVLETLEKENLIPVSVGNYWFAAGIKFTTYEVLETFILLIVLFGEKLKFEILGLSVLKLPRKGMGKQIVNLELAIKITFGPNNDEISILGTITPASWILSKDCKLSGGFAVIFWIKGQHKGDFVITLGGYHPRFKKPKHYPTVKRLALTWAVTDEVLISGQMYFALTSTAIMLGGKWSLSYTGSSVKASIEIWIDILLMWAPFYYDLEIGVLIKINAKITWFNYDDEISAQLRIWGPPFAGIAFVKWKVLSFEIKFGDHSIKKPPPLLLSEFFQQFLPGTTVNEKSTEVTISPINITIEQGIIEEQKIDKATKYVVNALQLKIKIDSTLPVTELLKDEQTSVSNLGVQPASIKNISTILSFKIEKIELNKDGIVEPKILYANTDKFSQQDFGQSISEKEAINNNNRVLSSTKISSKENAKFLVSNIDKAFPESLWSNILAEDAKTLDTPKPITEKGGLNISVKPKSLSGASLNNDSKTKNQTKTVALKSCILTDAEQGSDYANYQKQKMTLNKDLRDFIQEFFSEEEILKIENDKTKNLKDISIDESHKKIDWVQTLRHKPMVCKIGQM